MTKQEILDREGFDFVSFEYENEYSGKSILNAMEQYASQQSAALESENKQLRDLLRELYELKEMKERGFPATHKGAEEFAVYMVRKREAWEAARKLVKQ